MSAVVTLKKGEGRALKQGGAWIFDNEIASILGAYENGDIVLVRDFDGYPMGRYIITFSFHLNGESSLFARSIAAQIGNLLVGA